MPAFDPLCLVDARLRCLGRIALLSTALWAGTVLLAQEKPRPPFEMSSRLEVVEGMEPRQRLFVACGTNEFAVLLPPGYAGQAAPGLAQAVFLQSRDGLTSIGIERIDLPLRQPDAPSVEECRAALLAEFSGGSIVEELVLGAGDRQGPAFDLNYTDSARQARWVRCVFVPSKLGLLRFTLRTNGETFFAARADLNRVMGTFVAGERGRLTVPPISNLF
jgi:hypothetical protein